MWCDSVPDHFICAIEHNVVYLDNEHHFLLVIQEAETNLKPVEDSGASSQSPVPGRSLTDYVEARYGICNLESATGHRHVDLSLNVGHS